MLSILVIDPNSELRAFIADVLTRAGHSVAEATDVLTGRALLRRESVQLVVSDLAPTSQHQACAAAILRREFPDVEFVPLADAPHCTSCLRLAACLGGRRTREQPFPDRTRIALVNELVAGVAAYRAHADYQSSRVAVAS